MTKMAIMAQVSFLVVLSTLTILTFIQAKNLACLSCEKVSDPRLCKRTKDCTDGEMCGTQKINNEFGEYKYNLGCLSEKVCRSYVPLNNTDSTNTCFECCETSLCNSKGCGTPGYPTERGPICYDCELTPNGQCHDINVCSHGEVCSITGTLMFNMSVYTTKCLNQDHCARFENGTNRRKRSNEQQICEACCSLDLCNKDCGASEKSTEVSFSPEATTAVETNTTSEANTTLGANPISEATTAVETNTTSEANTTLEANSTSEATLAVETNTSSEANTTLETNTTPEGNTIFTSPDLNTTLDTNITSDTILEVTDGPTDCYDIFRNNQSMSNGIYNITTWRTKTQVQVLCHNQYTVFQRRVDGTVNFTRNFTDYQKGFGNLNGEFWLGLDLIQEMTNQAPTMLAFHLVNESIDLGYSNFSLGSGDGYTFHINYDKNGPIEDWAMEYNNGQNFSTFDHDQDSNPNINCAQTNHGGWWYRNCTICNLNGEYMDTNGNAGMKFAAYNVDQGKTVVYKIKESYMMFAREDNYDYYDDN